MGCSNSQIEFDPYFRNKVFSSGIFQYILGGDGGLISHENELKLKEAEKEEKIFSAKLKTKIDELMVKMNQAEPNIIAEGNYCSNPCYEYNENLKGTCPKCGGKVTAKEENKPGAINYYYDYYGNRRMSRNACEGCCDKFNYKNIDKIDYDIDALCEYFSKYDENNKRYYMILDGEKFYCPIHFSLRDFLLTNNRYFFGYGRDHLAFFFEWNRWRPELGQSLGDYQPTHVALLYECHKCGYIYHILRTSPFRYRDKSKDNIIEEKAEEEKNEKL